MANFNPLQLALKPLLDKAREDDALFDMEVAEKESRTESPKSWKECCEYIMGEAYEYASKHKNGNFGLAGMSDEDMQGLIKHYYDEDDIVIKKMGAGTKVQTTKVEETEEQKKAREEREAKEKAEREKREAEYKKQREEAEAKAKAEREEKERIKAEKQRIADLKANKDCGDMFAEFFS